MLLWVSVVKQDGKIQTKGRKGGKKEEDLQMKKLPNYK